MEKISVKTMMTWWCIIADKERARGKKNGFCRYGERLRVCVNIDMATYEQSLTRGRLSRKLRVCALEWPNNLDPTPLVDPVAVLMDPTAHTVLPLINWWHRCWARMRHTFVAFIKAQGGTWDDMFKNRGFVRVYFQQNKKRRESREKNVTIKLWWAEKPMRS